MIPAHFAQATLTLPSDLQIQITRVFQASRPLVYRAWTTPELIKQWWSSDLGTTTLVEMDLRVGGHWRYVMVTHGGHEVGFHGTFQEIVPDQHLVCTEFYEGMPGSNGAVNTVTFEDHPQGTLLTLLITHHTRQERDLHLQSGMEAGLQKALHFLEEVSRALH